MKLKMMTMISVLLLLLSTGCSATEQQELKNITQDMVQDSQAEAVKNMTLDSGVKLGDLVDAGVSSATYEIYDPAEDGGTYVTIKGNITYDDIPVVVTLQYKKTEDDYYEFYTMTYNDLPQNAIQVAAFYQYLNDAYAEQQ